MKKQVIAALCVALVLAIAAASAIAMLADSDDTPQTGVASMTFNLNVAILHS